MSIFDNREQAFENKFANDQELQFKVIARRNKLLGLWVAEKFGLAGQAAVDYATSVVQADFQKPGDSDVIEKILADAKNNNVAITEAAIKAELVRLLPIAKTQIAQQAA
jgi:hypothetical protein